MDGPYRPTWRVSVTVERETEDEARVLAAALVDEHGGDAVVMRRSRWGLMWVARYGGRE